MKIDNNQLLRFTTAGSVDDGKSTLIGRLLYDSKSIFEDQLDAIEVTSKRRGHDGVDLALFTDGLKDDSYSNNSNNPVDVVYTIVPVSSDGVEGGAFTLTVTVNPKPIVADQK